MNFLTNLTENNDLKIFFFFKSYFEEPKLKTEINKIDVIYFPIKPYYSSVSVKGILLDVLKL